ncbi:hypothetical protein TNCV_734621 [Trichonephila clavipes]|nr:hypothetical protein TNCV_734621 [Trichonephila clavipes]
MSSFLVLSEWDTRNRWRDGQVCPDVGQGTMAPWARRLGCLLACYAQIGRGRSRETFERKQKRGENGREEKGRGRKRREIRRGPKGRRRKKRRKRVGERERGARLVWRKGLSPGVEWKDDERRWR